jgi:hypothetical protein
VRIRLFAGRRIEMKVKILIEFDVDGCEDEEEDGPLTENIAKAAASMAAYDFLTFCTVSGVNTDTEEVVVHVDGYGQCEVRLGEDHE